MLTFPIPAPVNGDLLAQQFAAAGLPTRVAVSGDLLLLADLDEAQRAAASAVIAAHPATAQAALDTATAANANEATIRQHAAGALTSNKAFLALTSPTNAQVLAQVKALTRQQNGLIRLALQSFDGTD